MRRWNRGEGKYHGESHLEDQKPNAPACREGDFTGAAVQAATQNNFTGGKQTVVSISKVGTG